MTHSFGPNFPVSFFYFQFVQCKWESELIRAESQQEKGAKVLVPFCCKSPLSLWQDVRELYKEGHVKYLHSSTPFSVEIVGIGLEE